MVFDMKPTLTPVDRAILIELTDASHIARIFAHRPDSVALHVFSPEQPLTTKKVSVRYEGAFARP